MGKPNFLFIMCDQLRQDYLGYYGHPHLETPHLDRLARDGVRFANANCQAPLCGPSRASFYTGRYQSSHGVMGNEDATALGERMMADYLRPLGYRCALVGKTHSFKSADDLLALGADPDGEAVQNASTGGFEPYEWHEGLYPDPMLPEGHGYTDYLRSLGYDAVNPWDRAANSGIDSSGRIHSGWLLRHARLPAAVREEHSETAFLTDRAIDFIRESGTGPWCLHLSYIKPHWPIVAPAPYHCMYGAGQVKAPVRSGGERVNPHPVVAAFMELEYSLSYARDEVRDTVIPIYMGLIRQIDDHLGRLLSWLRQSGGLDNTVVVFTSDHGDYLGDHWLGEKDLFHEPSVRIPLIIRDPRAEADRTRGTVRDEFVESVDVLPTLIELAGGDICRERIEGRSLNPLLENPGLADDWRDATVSEIDYSERGARALLGMEPYRCRAFMVRDRRWKYVHYLDFPAQLFDLVHDPDELSDLGQDPGYAGVRRELKDRLFEWHLSLRRRTGLEYGYMEGQGPERDEQWGVIIGRW
ncbi:MAG: sulfatase-like hydrolase/transferase [Gammaproteobacteria bacterium]|nr:sulfatase-like hydrolase/transferase [Gammaproteobacteria bacterium]MYD77064.1 sulfatase-like hydrolase/transferase [Gammaproteobacteria bacterium]MYJ52239.1 sulfatase-like hydrolase/transferase [Gammaproteobacteria bacterium]